ncbi:hypothetical protein Maes01_02703 [Microbulbifer aestuariivivens]|uniref:Transglutaminase-like domain-containing protein n=1 Tax=Microbulbifer aestuariivivens TaxID=1908308 RepID=A0ABP9WSL1_9GAMM
MIRIFILLTLLLQFGCASHNAVKVSRQAGIEPKVLLQLPATIAGETARTGAGSKQWQSEEWNAKGSALLQLSPEMRRYLRSTAKDGSAVERMNAVLRDMRARGFYLQYDLNRTTSAAEAFALQQGNCVSHAAMIVAMARYLGLEAYVNQGAINVNSQLAESQSGVRFRQNISHINAVLLTGDGAYIIEQDNKIYPGKNLHLLDDRKAKSLYLNNLAMEAMFRDELEQAFVYMRNAIALDDDSSALWVGLGTIHRRMGFPLLAQQSFTHALNLNGEDAVAQHNLALLQESMQVEETYADNFSSSDNLNGRANLAAISTDGLEIQLLAR